MSTLRAGIALALGVGLLLAGGAGAVELAEGDAAPDFVLQGSDGRSYTLADFKGSRGLVLAWFPKAFTPGWSRELEALRDSAEALAEFEAAVFMVSLDTPERNREFAESLGAEFVLLSDPTGLAADAYGVRSPGASTARRWTFTIDREGVIRAIDRDVRPASAGQDIVRQLEALGFPRKAAGSP